MTNLQLFEDNVQLAMPEEYFGANRHKAGGNKTAQREWTEQEIGWIKEQIAAGYKLEQIADAIGRTKVSVSLKIKRLSKKEDTYNDKNREEKYAANQQFLDYLQPKNVLDVYAGNSYYAGKVDKLLTNDKDTKFNTDYHYNALTLMCMMYIEEKKFDLIDLDPYGSAYECFDLAIKLAKKGVIVSFGEWGHKRWKRYDFLKTRYNISSEEEFSVDKFIAEFQRIALTNKKRATPINIIQYDNFLRVYFELEKELITEQWATKEN